MRRLLDAFAVALENLADHKLRTLLTTLGMMFGVGAVIAMLSIGAGAEREALTLIDRLGIRNVVVRAKTYKPDELEEIRKKSIGLSQRDVEAIEEAVPGVDFAAARLEIEPYKVLSGGGKTKARVFGVGYRHREVTPFALFEGRMLDAADDRDHAQVAVIGAAVRRELFGADPALGKDLKINDVWFEVVGVLAPEATPASAVQGVAVNWTERELYLPLTTALRKLDRDPLKSPLTEIVLRLTPKAPARLEFGAQGTNPRFIVTNLDRSAEGLYDDLYCQSGEAENRIKETQLDLFGTRASCHKFLAN